MPLAWGRQAELRRAGPGPRDSGAPAGIDSTWGWRRVVFGKSTAAIRLVGNTSLLLDEDGIDAETLLFFTLGVHHNVSHGKRSHAVAALEMTGVEHVFGDLVEDLAGRLGVSRKALDNVAVCAPLQRLLFLVNVSRFRARSSS